MTPISLRKINLAVTGFIVLATLAACNTTGPSDSAAVGNAIPPRVAVDFEGEADPDRMKLDMKTWTWLRTNYNNDTQVLPQSPTAFTLTFHSDGSFNGTTDCNTIRGSYEVDTNRITFGPVMSTRMYCDGSQEQTFIKLLEQIQSFFFTSAGKLVFDLKFDSGSAVFR